MIVVGGENLIDFIQVQGDGDNPVYQANPGGSPYNCAMAIGLQQVPVSYLTPISSDSLGDLLAGRLQGAGVVLCGERRSEPTSLAVVSMSNASASYQFYRQNTADRMVEYDRLLAALPAQISAFHTGSLTITDGADAEIWADFYLAMKRRGVFTSLDPNIRAAFITDRTTYMARLDRILAATDLLKLSDEDLAWLIPNEDLESAAQQLMGRSSARLVVVTLGDKGAFALTQNDVVRIHAAPVAQLVDTVGAGDTFMATLLCGLYQGGHLDDENPDLPDVQKLLERAALAAALNCQSAGCNPPDLQSLNAAQSQGDQ